MTAAPPYPFSELMTKTIALLSLLATVTLTGYAQTAAQRQTGPAPATAPRPVVPQRTSNDLNLADYGVSLDVEPRLIVMMAALEAAGFDPLPANAELSLFRAQVRKDLSQLDPDLRRRLRSFYDRNKPLPLPAPQLRNDK